ncbi:hypothetical protein N7527_003091 [Penicillium freii]|nr:hypothetical protein N7527_003091 [Penicillium freii]
MVNRLKDSSSHPLPGPVSSPCVKERGSRTERWAAGFITSGSEFTGSLAFPLRGGEHLSLSLPSAGFASLEGIFFEISTGSYRLWEGLNVLRQFVIINLTSAMLSSIVFISNQKSDGPKSVPPVRTRLPDREYW